MNESHIKGIISYTAIGTAILMSYVGWNALQTIQNAKDIVGTQKDISGLQAAVGDLAKTLPALDSKITQAQVDSAVTVGLIKLMAPQFGVNPKVVENQVNKEFASTTP